MGKRSRKRGGPAGSEPVSSAGTTRAERDAARTRRVQAAEKRRSAAASGGRPAPVRRRGRSLMVGRAPGPWGKFTVVVTVVLGALILISLGVEVVGSRCWGMLICE